jgi:hypothetical protein
MKNKAELQPNVLDELLWDPSINPVNHFQAGAWHLLQRCYSVDGEVCGHMVRRTRGCHPGMPGACAVEGQLTGLVGTLRSMQDWLARPAINAVA